MPLEQGPLAITGSLREGRNQKTFLASAKLRDRFCEQIKFSQKVYPEDLFSQKFSMDTADRDEVQLS